MAASSAMLARNCHSSCSDVICVLLVCSCHYPGKLAGGRGFGKSPIEARRISA
jgi:hypothetical protein